MKISYNWLKEYLELDLPVEEVAEILTDIGLEVEGLEKFESVKGGLEGIVIGEVLSVKPHPNADRLQLTKIEVGHDEPLRIVCGAPNVAEGQKVVVALVGSTLYPDEKGFKIKKSKIRGEVSEGMLCAEDEIGLGESHEGIMVLDKEAKVGQRAADFFQLKSDFVFEIGLTPNRVDAASHIGVARDLAAYLKLSEAIEFHKPSTTELAAGEPCPVAVEVKAAEACPRYSGIVIENLKVEASPEWLQNRLRAIGLSPINNVVDITNYVMHELGQPLHAFDLAKVKGNQIQVKGLSTGTKFTTLDEVERELSDEDLMICNAESGMCIAGVFGGIDSGVSEQTKAIFLESAYFNPVSIRKTAKRHALNTDASFRYERGADPNITIKALERAAYLLKEVAGGQVKGGLIDHYPEKVEDFLVELNYKQVDRLLGQKIDRKTIKAILTNLEMDVLHETKEGLRLNVPAYRVDVQREVDLIEEILRIYGYNRIKLPEQMKSAIITRPKHEPYEIEEICANLLSNSGFSEVFNNSLTNPSYYGEANDLVEMINPLSRETEVMRKSMLYGGLEAIAYNQNRKRKNLKFYEFGKTYRKGDKEQYTEQKHLAIWLSGDWHQETWQEEVRPVDFYDLKAIVEKVLQRLGLSRWKGKTAEDDKRFVANYQFVKGKQLLAQLTQLSPQELKRFDIEVDVFYAEINWNLVLDQLKKDDIQHKAVSKFPAVRRDLALLIEDEVDFQTIQKIARTTEQHLLQEVNLFDVYEGKNLPKGKKSYGVSFTFQDANKTLTDKQVDRMMERLIEKLKKEVGAELR
ncbi:MAG: phenylalanine--tRNA ligase subunit beta [Vicingaceae bacterium]